MAITAECEQCFRSYQVSDSAAGKSFSCKECGSRVRVPHNREVPVAPVAPPPLSRPRSVGGKSSSRKPTTKRSAGNPTAVWIGGGVVVAALVAAAALFFSAGNHDAAPAGVPVSDSTSAPPTGDSTMADAAPASTSLPVGTMVAASTSATAATNAPLARAADSLQQSKNLTVSPTSAGDERKLIAWAVNVDPPPSSVEWPDVWRHKVSVTGDEQRAIYPPVSSPYAAFGIDGYNASGLEVFDLSSGKRVGKLKGSPPKLSKAHLSLRGTHVAFELLGAEHRGRVQIWSLETGAMVNELQLMDGTFNMPIVLFCGPDRVAAYGFGKPAGEETFVHRLRVVNFVSGDLVHEDNDPNITESEWAVSPGGRYFVAARRLGPRGLRFFDLTTGAVAGELAQPRTGLSPTAFAFSQAGDRFACLLSGLDQTVLQVVDVVTGELSIEHEYPASFNDFVPGLVYQGPNLEWLVGDVGWLLGGTLAIEADGGRRLLAIATKPNELELDNPTRRVPVKGGLVMATGKRGNKQLQRLAFPFEESNALLSVVDSDDAALRPGMSVSIDVQVGELRQGADSDETRAAIAEALERAVAADGLLVAADQPIVLRVGYREGVGQTLTQRSAPGPRPNQPAPTGGGPSVESSVAEVSLKWMRSGSARPLWEHVFTFSPRVLVIRGEASDRAARNAMFEQLTGELAGQPLPYFLSADGKTQFPATREIVYE